MAHEVTLIPGDGTGPELVEATRRVLEATGVEFEWDEQPAGEDVYAEEGNPFPDRTLDSIKRNGVGIKGPTTTPVGSGLRSINVQLRKELDLYACIRPCKLYEGVRSHFERGRHRDRPREHRGPVRGHRVRGVDSDEPPISCAESSSLHWTPETRSRSTPGSRSSRSRCSGRSESYEAAFDYARAQWPSEGDGGPQGQHHQVLRWPVSGDRPQGGRAPTPRSRSRTGSSTTSRTSWSSPPRGVQT